MICAMSFTCHFWKRNMELSEDKKSKIKIMFNLKYIECLMPSMFDAINNGTINDENLAAYSFANLKLDQWKNWKENQGIREEVQDKKNYLEIDGIANSTLFVPKEFVEKALVLGFLP